MSPLPEAARRKVAIALRCWAGARLRRNGAPA